MTSEITPSAIHPVRKREINEDQKKKLSLPKKPPHDFLPVHRHDIPGLSGFVLYNVLSPSECDTLVQAAEEIGFSFWDTTRTEPRKDFRDADTIESIHPELAELLWSRMGPFVDAKVELNDTDHKYWQSDLQGTWLATSINQNLLFGRYQENGHFAPHTDGCTVLTFNHRSMYSIILYLNHCTTGGSTHMYEDEQLSNLVLNENGFYTGSPKFRLDTIKPVRGSALVFYHAIVHEGEPVGVGGRKYIIRTDVMYEREVPICNAPNDVEAFRLYEQAKEMTNDGDPEEAVKLFRRAFKLSPALAEVFQM